MFVVYNNQLYFSSHVLNRHTVAPGFYLVTHDSKKTDAVFRPYGDCFIRSISLDDGALSDIYDIRFFIGYSDETEPGTEWNAAPCGISYAAKWIVQDEIELCIGHGRAGPGWRVTGKSEARKTVRLSDCTGFAVEKIYTKKSGHYVDSLVFDKKRVMSEGFKSEMLRHVRLNI